MCDLLVTVLPPLGPSLACLLQISVVDMNGIICRVVERVTKQNAVRGANFTTGKGEKKRTKLLIWLVSGRHSLRGWDKEPIRCCAFPGHCGRGEGTAHHGSQRGALSEATLNGGAPHEFLSPFVAGRYRTSRRARTGSSRPGRKTWCSGTAS